MSPQPEEQAREQIDALLGKVGWHVCDSNKANIHAARGVAIRECPLKPGHGEADYLLYVDGKAAGLNIKRAQSLRQSILTKAFGE